MEVGKPTGVCVAAKSPVKIMDTDSAGLDIAGSEPALLNAL